MSRSRPVILVLLVMLLPTAALAQGNPRHTKMDRQALILRQADALARAGRSEQAVKLYSEVLDNDPGRGDIYYKIANLLPGKENAATLLRILDNILPYNRNDQHLQAEYARLQYLLGDKDSALSTWQALISERQGDRFIYTVVMNAMLKVAASEEAVALLLSARESLQDSTVFAYELARIYGLQNNYIQATREYLSHLELRPTMLNPVSDQLIAMANSGDAADLIEGEIRAYLPRATNPDIHRLTLAKLYLHWERYADCVLVAQGMDRSQSLNDILRLGKDLKAEGAWSEAAELFILVSTHSDQMDMRGEALLNLASAYEGMSLEQNSYTSLAGYYENNSFLKLDMNTIQANQTLLERTFHLYDSLQALLPATPAAFRAAFQIAELSLTTSGDVDRAIRGFDHIFGACPLPLIRRQAAERLVDAWLVRGDTSAALASIEKMIQSLHLDEDDPEVIAARIKVYMFMGNADRLRYELLNLTGAARPDHPLYNDAFEVLNLINENEGDPSLETYLRAEKLIREHKLMEAVTILFSINEASAGFTDEAAIRGIQILKALGHNEDAFMHLNGFLDTFTDSPWRPVALVWKGEYLQFVKNDTHAAIGAYEELIINHPTFLGTPAIRLRIRELIGEDS